MNSYYRVGVWIHRIDNDKNSYVRVRVWIHIIDKKYEFILYIRWGDKRKDWLTSKTIVDADAAAAAGEVVNATTSATAAADINDECLRGLSAPAGNVTSEGGASVSMADVSIQWCDEEWGWWMNLMVRGGRGRWLTRVDVEVTASMGGMRWQMVRDDVASAHAVIPK
jgi:hypothetical protein